MAGHARFTALLDACVIFPVAVLDSLLSAAQIGLYAPKWSTAIEAEWMRHLQAKKGLSVEALERRRDKVRAAYPDWEVPEAAWGQIAPCLQIGRASCRERV